MSRYLLVTSFGDHYELDDPDYLPNEGGFQGPCLIGEFRELGKNWAGQGHFRVDRIESLDPIPEQLEMRTEAA